MKLLLVAALILASFAHTAFSVKSGPNGMDARAYSAQYTLPDGTLPVLCDLSGDGEPHHNTAVPCEFCSIAGAAMAPAPQCNPVPYVFRHYAAILVPQDSNIAVRPTYKTLFASQAPPVT